MTGIFIQETSALKSAQGPVIPALIIQVVQSSTSVPTPQNHQLMIMLPEDKSDIKCSTWGSTGIPTVRTFVQNRTTNVSLPDSSDLADQVKATDSNIGQISGPQKTADPRD